MNKRQFIEMTVKERSVVVVEGQEHVPITVLDKKMFLLPIRRHSYVNNNNGNNL